MTTNPVYSSDVAFTEAVKAIQERRGSRQGYGRMEAKGGFRTEVTSDLISFLADIDTAYLATANAAGQPYAQHRGGPKGFIRVIDEATLGFADYTGNRQYISTGNLTENGKAFLFLMDYAHRRRVKLWGTAHAVEGDEALIASLMPEGYDARPEQAILFRISAWDTNCPQHIPPKIDVADVNAAFQALQLRLQSLEAENAALLTRLALQEGKQGGIV